MDDNAVPDLPVALEAASLQALHDKEVSDLRALINQLLLQLEFLRQQHASAQTLESHVVQLREANEHLVLATFSAQDKQASAEDATQRQSSFLSMLAHELRNPLQPIAHANALLGKLADSNPELVRLQAIIERQIGHMSRLIEDLLDASRISSGKIGLDKAPLLLADVLAAAVEASQPQIDARQQQLKVVLPPGTTHVYGDCMRLAQVFSNLLNNASKFSPEHEVIVVTAQEVGRMVQVSVRDHGMGMPAELQPFIFDLFTQGLQSLDRAQGGLGIGLTLVRSLVEMHGGTVLAHSGGIGLGSTFNVLLPMSVAAATRPTLPLPALASPHQRRILLVEDNHDANETLSQLLELGGHTVVQCYDGAHAVEQALAQRFDVVICDIGLPSLDGFAVAEAIRAGPAPRAPYFIATSGYNQPQDRTRAVRSGFDHYLVKPVAIAMLLALIDLHVH
ncbi:hypothetical protein RugamoR64_24510 [Duganella rhizosphaerae]|uniref:hybrid sensor histidine kinase/response regulator n=1 Tax=Duganella rhizosphaerae TaxID=2885763 RepID=UPI0030E85DE3